MSNTITDKEMARLAALYELKILDTPPEERFDRITRLAALILGANTAYIAFLDDRRQWFKSKFGFDTTETPRNISFCTYTIQHEGPMVVPDALLDPRFANSPLVTQDPHTRFYAGYPLSTADGSKVGTLCVTDKMPKDMSPEDLAVLKDLAEIVEDQLALVDVIKLEQQIRTVNTELVVAKQDLQSYNEFIRKAFSCYMSDEVVTSLLKSSQPLILGGEERRITALFSDLRNFTVLAQQHSAARVVETLNIYYSAMVDIILKHKGTIDAFIGDAIMVLFGAPTAESNDALRAVACATEMQAAMQNVNAEIQRKGLPQLEMGIGINTGDSIVGNIGSAKRMKYSAIGAPINLAARIQDFSLGGQVLISETTLNEVRKSVKVNGHLRVKMKGIESPVTIYDIGGIRTKRR